MWKIPKQPKEEDGPGPGAYKAEEAIAKTRWAKIPNFNSTISFTGSEKRNDFITTTIKKNAKVPGPGHYKNAEQEKLLCKSRQLISPRQF